MVDRDDDVKIGIRTTALLFGKHDVAIVMLSYFVMLTILVCIGGVIGLGWPYFSGLTIAAGIALFHYTMIRKRDREQCFKAFLHNNWLGFSVFCGVMFDYALRT
jgi:4-hydroxybenzoate polyprenyltransferase